MRILATYKIKHPITLDTKTADGEEREEELKPEGFCIVLRRMKAKDLKVMDAHDGADIAATIALLTRISNLDAIECENLDAADLAELGNLVSEAKASGLKTGETA